MLLFQTDVLDVSQQECLEKNSRGTCENCFNNVPEKVLLNNQQISANIDLRVFPVTDRRWHGGSLLYELKDEGDPIEKNEFGILWHHRRVAVRPSTDRPGERTRPPPSIHGSPGGGRENG